MMEAKQFIQRFEQYCPLWLAEAGDPVGLHVGTLNRTIQRVMITLDVRPEVVAEAIAKQVDLLIAKHPPIFKPVKRLTTDDPQNAMYEQLLKHDIAVYAAHTNMDIISDGLNDWFCEELQLETEGFLTETHRIPSKKISVFVPTDASEAVRQALSAAGAGQLGSYAGASFTSTGNGRFTPLADAKPAIGTVGNETTVQEVKIEVLYPATIEKTVVQAMLTAHPYEEPAYDITAIENFPYTYGLGRVGRLAEPVSLEQFVQQVKAVFQLDGLRMVLPKNPPATVQRIAICGGSGEKFYTDAVKKQADVFITGDVYYHTAHDMQTAGLTVVDPGHYIESLCKKRLLDKFNEWKQQEDWQVEFIISETNTNPFVFK